jgi:hypothetical protein
MTWFSQQGNNSGKEVDKKIVLPPPDQYGNYWFKDRRGPAIFKGGKSAGLVKLGRPKEGDYWFISLGVVEGTVMRDTIDGKKIRYFTTPQEALEVLNEMIGPCGK